MSTCMVCGKELVVEESVERGIGPICERALKEFQGEPPRKSSSYTVNPDSVIIENRFRAQLGDLLPLIQSISKLGLLHPIVITENNRLVAGHRRLEAWKLLHKNHPIPITRVPDYIADAEIEENTVRENFTITEMVAIKRHYEPEITRKAKERMLSGVEINKNQPSANFAEGSGDTRLKIAKIAGVSHTTLKKAVKIVEAAEQDPETFGSFLKQVESGQKSIHGASIAVDRVKKRREKEALPTQSIPEGFYNIIYADPPWRYDFSETNSRAIENQYATMSLEDICSLDVPASQDSVLFLWATNPKLKEALEVIEAWGFTYKTNLSWVKDKIGMGYWFRAQHELLLVSTKGDFKPPTESVRRSGVLESPRRKHSQKPDEVYEIIESYFPNGTYLELFSRNKRENWIMWGNEAQ